MTGTVTRLQTRARIRSDFLAQSPADHRLLVDERARLHEGDDYYSRDKSSTVNAAAICALLMAGLIVVGSVVQIVGWVSG